MAKWMLRRTTVDIASLSRQTGLPPVLARILAVRGYKTPEAIKSFINTNNKPLSDPLLFADMEKAVETTAQAIAEQKKIAIFGDYDADGIMSTVILYRTLASLGANVDYYIPSREEEGYGLNINAIDKLHQQGIELIIACDNGISAFAEIEHATELAMATIILDHHAVFIDEEQGKQTLPLAMAVVDAKRTDCQYPFKHYCAAGLCYRFSEALYAYCQLSWDKLGEYLLPFATIATICDLVELEEDNRCLVKKGLPLISKSNNIGLNALLAATKLKDKQIDTYHVGFILGPCINASGRLDIADIAVELFLTDNLATAQINASSLVELNAKRKALTEEGTKLALIAINEQKLAANKIIVLHCPQVLESVAGIIAGKIKERYHKPVIIIAGDKEILHGSCRSIENYNIFEGLKACQEYLLTFGGHPMAAGLSIESNNIASFAHKINSLCELTNDDMEAIYRIDCQLPPIEANLTLAKQLNLLAPYGKGNAKPLFAYKSLSIEKITLVGREDKVMRLLLKDEKGWLIELINFSAKDRMKDLLDSLNGDYWPSLLTGKDKGIVKLDIIYSLNINSFNGKDSAQLQLVDFRLSQ